MEENHPTIAINEIFTSIDGEVNRFGQGGLTTFIRFAGCSRRCSYCDTKYAQKISDGEQMEISEIVSKIKTPKVTITGGEPLEQIAGLKALMYTLLDPFRPHNFKVTVETNGTEPIPFDSFAYAGPNLGWVIDYKLEYDAISPYRNFRDAGPGDWIKIVIDEFEKDYPLAIAAFKDFRKLGSNANFALGFTKPSDAKLALERLLEDEFYDVTFNFQIHKFIDMK